MAPLPQGLPRARTGLTCSSMRLRGVSGPWPTMLCPWRMEGSGVLLGTWLSEGRACSLPPAMHGPPRRLRARPGTSWAGPARAAWAELLLNTLAGGRRDILLPLLSPPDCHFHRPGRSQRPLEELLPAYADLRPVQTPARHPEPVLPSLRGHRVCVWRGQPRQGRHSVSGVEEGVASRLDSGSPDPWQVPGTAPFREAGSQVQPPAPSWAEYLPEVSDELLIRLCPAPHHTAY